VQRPFFTLILVSLNPGDALGRTLESITRQTVSDYEILIKDGGSTDGEKAGTLRAFVSL
jgi:glycosyltransferase involved in cell wall biosynthesis